MSRPLTAMALLVAATLPAFAGTPEAEPQSRRAVAIVRARFGAPLSFSASLGGIWDRRGHRPDCRLTCDLRGPVLQGEIGLRGAQLAAGYGAMVADRAWAAGIVSDAYVGVAVKGVAVRTWDGLGLSPGAQWLMGVEVEAALSRFNFSVGLLRTFDSAADQPWEWTGGVGWGF